MITQLVIYPCITKFLEGFCPSNILKCTNSHYFVFAFNEGIPKRYSKCFVIIAVILK